MDRVAHLLTGQGVSERVAASAESRSCAKSVKNLSLDKRNERIGESESEREQAAQTLGYTLTNGCERKRNF